MSGKHNLTDKRGGGVPAQLLPHFRCPTGLLILHGILCIFYVFLIVFHCISLAPVFTMNCNGL